jgi:hypothetical protein
MVGITVVKDNQEVAYTDRILDFMNRIRSCDF